MKKHFVATTDEKTAELLRSYGYEELPKQGNKWVFINEPKDKATFSSENVQVYYTDILTF